MAYIKTHSNYVLKKRHKFVNGNRTVFERDITTIGGVNQFAPGQIPMYRSGNFIITVNNENTSSRHIKGGGWAENPSGVTWTERIIAENYDAVAAISDTNQHIYFNKDFYRFTDFAYYGSLSNMVKASLGEIIKYFPGELYFTGIEKDADDNITNRVISVNYTVYDGGKEIIKRLGGDNWYLVSNPFGIDIHSTYLAFEDIEMPLRYFLNGGFMEYELILEKCSSDSTCKYPISYEGVDMNPLSYLDYEFEEGGTSVTLRNTNNFLPLKLTFEDGGQLRKETIGPGETLVIDSTYAAEEKFSVDGVELEEEHKEVTVSVSEDSVLFNVVSERIYEIAGFELLSASLVFCKGDQIGNVVIYGIDEDGNNIEETKVTIGVWIGDNYQTYYLIEDCGNIGEVAQNGFHLRPREENFLLYYSLLTDFEKVLLNRKTDPLYKATFEVTTENDAGYTTRLETFIYPVGLGGYNIGSYGEAYANYVNRLINATSYYDEYFCDNLYRSMTHEAIKNLDWSFQRETREDLVEAYGEGENKISSFLRIAGAEFDNIKQYVDNIPTIHSVTYKKNGNIPDYFITDSLELDGWDLKLTCPFQLNEIAIDEEGNEIDVTGLLSEEDEILNAYSGSPVTRNFSQDNGKTINPYSKDKISEEKRNGYFLACECESGDTVFKVSLHDDLQASCKYEPGEGDPEISAVANPFGDEIPFDVESYREVPILSVFPASPESGETYIDCTKKARNIIRQYSDNVLYTYGEANMEFLRRLKINSRELARSKGTYDGIEKMLSLFGMRSKRWYESSMYWKKEQLSTGKDGEWTYSINATPENTDINQQEQDVFYNVDSFKEKDTSNLAFPYDFEIKEYTLFTPRIEDIWYPKKDNYMISWCNETKLIGYPDTDDQYDYAFYKGLPVMVVDQEDIYIDEEGKETENECLAAKNLYGDNVHARYIYPMFDKTRRLDGNPYYQMLGGWERTRPIRLNEDSMVLHYKVEDLFKETVQNVRKVQTLPDLLALPTQSLFDGQIYFVDYFVTDYGIIDGKAYELYTDENGYDYMTFSVFDGSVEIGDAYFNNAVTVSSPYANNELNTLDITLQDKTDGYEFRVYVVNGTVSAQSISDSISSFVAFKNGQYKEGEGYTHYFRINSKYFPNEISENGWEQLTVYDKDYYKLNAAIDYFKGNNPHNGKLQYDCGHEYLEYFHKLFKYAEEENLIDSQCYDEEDIGRLSDMEDVDYTKTVYGGPESDEYFISIPFGFKNLISPDHEDKNYDRFLNNDDKIHYFGNYISNDYGTQTYGKTYGITNISMIEGGDKYGSNIRIDYTKFPYTIDNVTNQIVNTKRMELLFYLHSKDYMSKEYLEEVKYLQDIVLPYVEQMIPATMIWSVRYIVMGEEEYILDPLSESDLMGLDLVVTFTENHDDDDELMTGYTNYDINVRLVGTVMVNKKVYGSEFPLSVTVNVDMDVTEIAEIVITSSNANEEYSVAWVDFDKPRLTIVDGYDIEALEYDVHLNLSKLKIEDGEEFDIIPVLKRVYHMTGIFEDEDEKTPKTIKLLNC